MAMRLIANKQLTGVYGTVAVNQEFDVEDDKLAKELMARGHARSATAKPIHDYKMSKGHENKSGEAQPITGDTLLDRSLSTTDPSELPGMPHVIDAAHQPKEALKPFEADRIDKVDDKDAEQAGFRGSHSSVPVSDPKSSHVPDKGNKGVSGANVPKPEPAHSVGRPGHKPSHSK